VVQAPAVILAPPPMASARPAHREAAAKPSAPTFAGARQPVPQRHLTLLLRDVGVGLGLAKHLIGESQQLVEDHLQEIVDAWNRHRKVIERGLVWRRAKP
jgi:hypothetical protein